MSAKGKALPARGIGYRDSVASSFVGFSSVHVGPARGKGCPFGSFPFGGIRRCIPESRLHAIEIVNDFAILDGEFADELLISVESPIHHICEAEMTLLKTKNGNVSNGSFRETAQVFALDFVSRMRRQERSLTWMVAPSLFQPLAASQVPTFAVRMA